MGGMKNHSYAMYEANIEVNARFGRKMKEKLSWSLLGDERHFNYQVEVSIPVCSLGRHLDDKYQLISLVEKDTLEKVHKDKII